MGVLNNKIAIVTGSASGIGLATALLFANEGASLVLADLDTAGLGRVEKNLQEKGVRVQVHAGDISSSRVARHVAEEAFLRFGRIDILFNNAGIDLHARIEDTTEEDWDRILSVNLKSMFLLTKYVVPHMIGAGGGSIINTSSAVALYPVTGRPAYIAAKGGVVALTKALALDFAPNNIRVNCICPGAVNTPLLQGSIASAQNPSAALAAVIARYPLGRLGEADEIARVALFLASSESSYMTGGTLAIDGGRTMH